MRLILLFVASLMPLAGMADDTRTITREWPQEDLRTIEIEANVGTVKVFGSDRDTITLKLEIEPDDDFWGKGDRVQEIIEAAELEEDQSGDSLILDLRTPRSRGDNDIEEHWELQVPESMMAMVELNVGAAEIRDTSGGVEAEVNVGELIINVLRGDVDAEVNVGELKVSSRTASPGKFDLEVNIGDTSLEIDGERVGMDRGWLGGNIRHDAGGDDDVSAEVNVGDVSVEIE